MEVEKEISPEFVLEDVDEFLLLAGQTVLSYLSQEMVFGLQEVISAEGLTFLPYPSDWMIEGNQTFFPDALPDEDFLAMEDTFLWGRRDGSGEEIILTPMEYYERFIWDRNYLEAPEVLVGDEVASRGNTLVALGDIFAGARVIEYHFPGLDPAQEGMDWRSLYLVFVEEEGGLFLRAIAHGEWTT